MLSFRIHVGYEGSNHCRKKLTYPVLACCYPHVPHESLKKAFYCLNIV